jgi:hypothetical protein
VRSSIVAALWSYAAAGDPDPRPGSAAMGGGNPRNRRRRGISISCMVATTVRSGGAGTSVPRTSARLRPTLTIPYSLRPQAATRGTATASLRPRSLRLLTLTIWSMPVRKVRNGRPAWPEFGSPRTFIMRLTR